MQSDAFHLGPLADPGECHGPIDLAGTPASTARAWLRKLIEIRCAEEKIGDEFGRAVIKCPCHLVIGQEAPAVGVAAHIRDGDRVFGAHRSHAHFLALGGSLHHLLAEVLGKDTGCSRGMGGSMHLLDRAHNFHGSVPIVGATVPIATGAALAAKMDGNGAVAVSYLGDGATEEGVFHESLNFASVFKLPVLYVVENNLFSSHLHISLRQPFDSECRHAEAHGVAWQRVDGNDTVAMAAAAGRAIAAARAGQGPQLIEAVTYRWRGHVGHREDNDVGVQRKEGLAEWKKRDPVARLAAAMVAAGQMAETGVAAITVEYRAAVEAAWVQACADPYPSAAALIERVYSTGRAS
ncbi:MAG: thiamine pyrophosphate-dependent dehydrogenase E1 component subunit alpha [Verrucomicrobia bacterium]|nr:thiamine pyrophosphate-dependent dehydrogenase E1 component subunit alpha [Verrucomicrobiota bacterium]